MSDEVKIDKGIPVPNGSGATPKWPWKTMDIGDSFFAKDRKLSSFQPNAWRAGIRHGRKFACRTVEGGVRVWRTA